MRSVGAGPAGPAPIGAARKRAAAIEAIAELRHPHTIVMRATSTGLEPDLAGGRLFSELQKVLRGSPSLRVTLRIVLDVVRGLTALHRVRTEGEPLEFVHGEVAPHNIVVGRDGVARLVPLVKAHWSPGAPVPPNAVAYSAPEKLLGDTFDQRADVFSVGVLLWEAMEGRPLFHGRTADDVVMQLMGGRVNRPSAAGGAPWSEELAEVVARALAVNPVDRWDEMVALGAAIEKIADGHLAPSSELVALVTGREVSRDSFSDEVTVPLSSVPSLSPFANSIPVDIEEPTAPDSPGALSARRAEVIEPVIAASGPDHRPPERGPSRARGAAIASFALFGVLALGFVGYRRLAHGRAAAVSGVATTSGSGAPGAAQSVALPPNEFASSPVAAMGSTSASSSAPPASTFPSSASLSPASGGAPPAARATSLQGSQRGAPKSATSAGKAKPKEDPFGLMKTVPAKPKDDPFGL